jgi:alcohol dehydrogenase class IV
MSAKPYAHYAPGQITYGPGAASALGKQRPVKKMSRVLVVTDAGVKAAGISERVLDALGDKAVLIDDETRPDGDCGHINALAEKAKAAEVEGVVAIGGGSVIDTAKAVGVVLAKGGKIQDYEGFATIRGKLPPIVAIPTTAGTGAECTQFIVVYDAEKKRKLIISDLSVVPSHAVLDPELVTRLPREHSAATGVDALTHAIEALASRMRNPFGTALATEAARIILEGGLERSLAQPDSVKARGEMLSAACLAGQAISTSMLGACHAFAHALGAYKQVPHGVANGLFLVETMRFNFEKSTPVYARLGRALGGQGDDTKLAWHAVSLVEKAVHGIAGIPEKLSEVGIVEDDLDPLADLVMADPDLATNPVQLNEKSRALEVLRSRL